MCSRHQRDLYSYLVHILFSVLTVTAPPGGLGQTWTEPSRPETHPCYRPCSPAPAARLTCGYNFTLEYFWTLSKACYACPERPTDCLRKDCIPADSGIRGVAVVNRLLPGPAIRVCEGDRVIVNVLNLLLSEGTSLHWHGIHQKTSPWMDGVPGLTQCPIHAGASFRYEFEVPKGGTHFWHSHSGQQRADGLVGSLVVRKAKEAEAHSRLYDFDLAEHEVLIWDWLEDMTLPVFLKHHHSDGGNKPRNLLINGRGFPPEFFRDFGEDEAPSSRGKPTVPVHEIRVKYGKAYRIRIISNGALNCPIEVSFEGHNFQIIASDGVDLEAFEADSLVVYAGERWDVVLSAYQEPGSYWIKFRGLMDCDDRFKSVYNLAVLNYEGVPQHSFPPHPIRTWAEAGRTGIQVNPLNSAPGTPTAVTVADLSCLLDDDPEIIRREQADHQFYLSFDFEPIDNVHFHGPHIPISSVTKANKLYTPQINRIAYTPSPSPLLTQPTVLSSLNACNEEALRAAGLNCSLHFCECTHLVRVERGSVVELVLVDKGYTFDGNHPFHLHGHSFRVLAMGKDGRSVSPDRVKGLDRSGRIVRRRQGAPIKDTVTVPDGGWTVLRFRADNPGFWFFHCHLEFHVEVGMGLVLQVGGVGEMPAAPEGFPRCGSFAGESGGPTAAGPPVLWDEFNEVRGRGFGLGSNT